MDYKSGSKVVPLGAGQQSSNAWMGIDSRYATGSVGARETPDATKMGGDRMQGKLVGKRTSTGYANTNIGANEGNGSADRDLGAASKYAAGSNGAREDISATKYGGERKQGLGFVGKNGKNQTPKQSSGAAIYGGLKVQPGMPLIEGTAGNEKNIRKAQKGIGGTKGGNGNSKKGS